VIKESRKPKQTPAAGAEGESISTSESLQGTAETISGADDEVEAAIVSLVRQYRAACASGDTAAIAKLYNLTEVKNPHTFMAVATIITGYQNTACYIRPGLDDASKVVFIYDDLKLADFDTLVPNLSYVYVRAATDGSFYIYPGEYDEASMSYVYDKDILELIDNLEGDTEIAGLVKTVNEKFAQTCESNSALKDYIDQLSSVSDDQKNNDEPQSTAETDTSSEPVTESGTPQTGTPDSTTPESGTPDSAAPESGTPQTAPADNTNV